MTKRRKKRRAKLSEPVATNGSRNRTRAEAAFGPANGSRAVAVAALGYEAVENRPTRRAIVVSSRSEDKELTPEKRQALLSEARDQLRNFSLAGFALRKHLQFVSFYRFAAGTPDERFNADLTRRVERWKSRKNCDAAGRCAFDELIALIESHRAVDGDVGILRRVDGRIQIIEGDRIRNPPDATDDPGWVGGVKVSPLGRPLRYAIWNRKPSGGFDFERTVDARWFDLLSFTTRRDQIRGVSLFAPAVKMISYLYDGLDFALAKMKLEQFFGLKTTFEDGGALVGTPTTDAGEIGRQASEVFGGDLLHLALKVGEDAQFMESNNPSQNFQTFCENVVRMVFAALDVPYSFYDGSKTNFYGARGEFEQYLDTVERKQAPTVAMLNEWVFDWLAPNWLLDPVDPLVLPDGWTLDDVAADCGWRGAGLPSWRLFEYVKEAQAAISAGLVSPLALADSFGEDMRRNITEIAATRAFAKERGVFLPFGETQTINNGL